MMVEYSVFVSIFYEIWIYEIVYPGGTCINTQSVEHDARLLIK